jgi:hypothetical protein
VIYNNQVGTVVVAIDDNEGSQGFRIEEWSTQGTGILIRFDNEALLLLNDSDEHLLGTRTLPTASGQKAAQPVMQSHCRRPPLTSRALWFSVPAWQSFAKAFGSPWMQRLLWDLSAR